MDGSHSRRVDQREAVLQEVRICQQLHLRHAALIVVVLLLADVGVQVLRGDRLAETVAEVDRGVVAGF